MFLDPIFRAIRAPFDLIYSKIWGVRNIQGGIRSDIQRAKGMMGHAKDQVRGGVQRARSVGQTATRSASQVGAPPERAAAPPMKKAKMGLFSKKKKCPSCGQKLHVSWDQCPYCGVDSAAAQAPMPTGGRQRTMALDAAQAGPTGGATVGWLVPVEGPQTGELFQFKGRCVVGTAPDCDVVVSDPSISARHAELVPSGNGFRLNDLGSTNGTFVNEKRVSTQDLVDNDTVRLGRTNFKFKSMT